MIARASETQETSVFANLTFHLGEKTEVSAGARYIEFDSASTLVVAGDTLSDISAKESPRSGTSQVPIASRTISCCTRT